MFQIREFIWTDIIAVRRTLQKKCGFELKAVAKYYRDLEHVSYKSSSLGNELSH